MTPAEKIFHHLNDQLNHTKIESTDVKQYKVDSDKFDGCLQEIQEMLVYHLKNKGLCSGLLINQLARHRCQLGEIMGNTVEYYRASDICRLIENLELGKIEGDKFEKLPLKNLYKIHHGTFAGLGYGLVLNVKNYWFTNHGKIKNKRLKSYEEIVAKYGMEEFAAIASQMSNVAMFSKKLTGEWLIYTKQNGIKYYLCLATHNEGDQKIFDNKILSCYQEFPIIKE